MELLIFALLAWVFIGLAIAWLIGSASDLGDQSRKPQHDMDREADSRVSYRLLDLKGFPINRSYR
jgi:hypothetical protein